VAETKITAPAGLPYVDIEREFDAPRRLVQRAYSEPDLIKQWLGPRGYEMDIDRWDEHGYRYVHRDPQGNEYRFHGAFHAPLTIDGGTQTFEFEGAPGHVSLDTVVFEERGDKTVVRTHSVFQSVEDRDAMVEHGMSRGVTEGFERLDEVLASLGTPVGAVH
jgi:uncharacterized protein YndB with AHSA1/START domain